MNQDLKFQEMMRWASVSDLAHLTVQKWMANDKVIPFITHLTKERGLDIDSYEWRDCVTPKVVELWIDATRALRKDPVGAVTFGEMNERIVWWAVIDWLREVIRPEVPAKPQDTETVQEATIVS